MTRYITDFISYLQSHNLQSLTAFHLMSEYFVFQGELQISSSVHGETGLISVAHHSPLEWI